MEAVYGNRRSALSVAGFFAEPGAPVFEFALGAERAAELKFSEAEAVTQAVGGTGEIFELGAALGVEQVELRPAVRESAKAHAEKADLALAVTMPPKEFLKHRENIAIEGSGPRKGFRASSGIESSVANREGQSPSCETRFAQALACFLAEMAQHRAQRFIIIGVFPKCVIVRNRLRLGIHHEFIGIAAARLAEERIAPLAEDLFECLAGSGRKLPDDLDAHGAERAFGDLANSGNLAHGKLLEKTLLAARGNPEQAARLRLVGSDFGDEPRRAEPSGAGKAGRARDGAQQFVSGGKRGAVQSRGSGEIEIGFVNRDHFDDGRKGGENFSHAVAPLRILVVMPVEKNRMRAELARRAQRHCGLDSVFARFVARGGDDAALIGPSAHNDGLAAQFWALEQFDGDEEGVHIHVQNAGVRLSGGLLEAAMFRPKSREFRHGASLLPRQTIRHKGRAAFAWRMKKVWVSRS